MERKPIRLPKMTADDRRAERKLNQQYMTMLTGIEIGADRFTGLSWIARETPLSPLSIGCIKKEDTEGKTLLSHLLTHVQEKDTSALLLTNDGNTIFDYVCKLLPKKCIVPTDDITTIGLELKLAADLIRSLNDESLSFVKVTDTCDMQKVIDLQLGRLKVAEATIQEIVREMRLEKIDKSDIHTFLLKDTLQQPAAAAMTIQKDPAIVGIRNITMQQNNKYIKGYLLRNIIHHYASRNVETLHLFSTSQDCPFYEKFGFEAIERFNAFIIHPPK